jgi:tRNA-specific 2-thiouridylase
LNLYEVYNSFAMSKSVFAAMSGGVDSSVTAYLLKEAGYAVSGIHLELTSGLEIAAAEHNDLELTCQMLRIPIHFLNAEVEFKERVIEYFCQEYSLGRTPNPCIRCNKDIKFGLLMDKVREMGGDYLATGHYVRVEASAAGYQLLKGVDPAKDQSYFLYVLGQKELSQVLFPVGGLLKTEVKKLAADLGLPASVRRESQDICFVPGGDHRAFLNSRLKPRPGEIVDAEGNIRGEHKGLAYYTVGQRQGMGVSAGQRLYVIHLDNITNRLIIGPQDQLFKKSLSAHNLNFISGRAPEGCIEIRAKVRYRALEAKAVLLVKGNKADINFIEPQRAIALGQSVVFYQGESVLGGGIIAGTAE